MSLYRMVTFRKLCKLVCQRVPEAEPDKVEQYLQEYSSPPYSWRSAIYWARKIESMMIDEGSI